MQCLRVARFLCPIRSQTCFDCTQSLCMHAPMHPPSKLNVTAPKCNRLNDHSSSTRERYLPAISGETIKAAKANSKIHVVLILRTPSWHRTTSAIICVVSPANKANIGGSPVSRNTINTSTAQHHAIRKTNRLAATECSSVTRKTRASLLIISVFLTPVNVHLLHAMHRLLCFCSDDLILRKKPVIIAT